MIQPIWHDAERPLDLGATPLPQWRIVKEKRATFAAMPRAIAPAARPCDSASQHVPGR
jgi:hypothetical protein